MTVEVDVRDLVGRPGASRTVEVAEPVDGLGTELAFVPEDRPVSASLLMESVVEGMLATGPLSGVMVVRCARCLTSSERPFRVETQEMFTPGPDPTDDEYPLVDGFVDLEPMIRDAVLLAMPMAPLCRPDCLGLCPRCGGDRNLGECSCEPDVDARWAPLSALRIDTRDQRPSGRSDERHADAEA
jgi:uncharacterized protein